MLKKTLFWILLISVIYFPLFLHLDRTTLSIFDEARRGCNAIEMVENGNFLVTYFQGEPDMWGTKPPLLIWLQSSLMRMIGYNELAVRLPSALAGLALVFYLLFFSRRVLKSTAIGVFSLLVLITTDGYISDHITRTGDFDALLCLWLTLYMLTFFRFIHEDDPPKKKKYIYGTALFVFLAVLTKGVAGLFFLPGLFLFALISKQILPILQYKHFWVAVLGAIVGIMSFYLLREHYNPGYLDAVWNNELGGRYQTILEGHEKSNWFYLKRILEKNFNLWIFTLPFGIIAAYFGSAKERSLSLLLVINVLVFLLIISNAETKHDWYNAPVFPSLALLAGFGIAAIFKLGYKKLKDSKEWNRIAYIACFLVLFYGWAYYQIIDKVYEPELAWHSDNGYSRYMRYHKDLDNYYVGNGSYNAHTVFYLNASKLEGKNLTLFILKISKTKEIDISFVDPMIKIHFMINMK